MELMLDSANIDQVKKFADIYPFAGVTSNPSIIKEEGKIDFFNHFREIRNVIGKEHSLHIQVVSKDADDIVKEAHRILEEIDMNVYVKIPVTEQGIRAMKILKNERVHITATAIYTRFQGYNAIALGVDYLAVYYNRIKAANGDPDSLIADLRREIDSCKSKTKILSASFHYIEQVNSALRAGSHSVTITNQILEDLVSIKDVDKTVDNFALDFETSQGYKSILDIK